MSSKINKPKLSVLFSNPNFISPFKEHFKANFDLSWNRLPFTPPPNRWTPLLSIASFPFRLVYKKMRTLSNSRNSDIIFVEFADETLAFASKWRKSKMIVTRLHRYELFNLPKADWSAVDLVIVVNEWMGENLELAVPSLKGKIVCIHNFVDLNFWTPPSIKERTNVLSIVGTIYKRKGHDKAIVAFSKVLEKKNDLILNIIGNSPDETFYDDLKSLVKDLGIEDNVNFMGYASDLKLEFQKSDIILSFSEHESTHLTLFEGLSCGALPLSRNWEGVEEFLPSSNIFTDDSDFVDKVLSFYSKEQSESIKIVDELADVTLPLFSSPDPREMMSKTILEKYLIFKKK